MRHQNLLRRDFLKGSAGAIAAVRASGQTPSHTFDTSKKMIGIQVGAISFVDEGTEAVLDNFQKLAHINTIFLAVFTYGRGIAGRQIPGQPIPDHGAQEYDVKIFHGGNYAQVHPQYYKETGIRPEDTRAPDHGDLDILAEVLPKAKQRGMRVICWAEDVWRADIPGIEKLQEIDLHGRRARTLCFNNPYHRNFLLGLVEDYARSYEIDGIMWGSERQGAFNNALGSRHGGLNSDPGRVTCFCNYCQEKAKKLGINFDRVREGYLALEKWVRAARAGNRPVDGHYVTLWRLLFRYPEIIMWEAFWTKSLRETQKLTYQKLKELRPQAVMGWHIWHNNSFSPFYRAEQDLQELGQFSDFLKVVMYHNCGGERMASYVDSVATTIYADLPKQQILEFHYKDMNYEERSYDQIPFTGLSADYVYRETKRAIEGAKGTNTLIWPGIDIDIPTAPNHSKSTPQGTKAAVIAAFKAGADGVILSRKYSEMWLRNLRGAGEAIEELGLA